jgi:mRNA degradation ribonuclease J1/J2
LQIVFDIALQFNRRVCVLGRSMQKNVEIADRLGYLDIHDGLLVGVKETKQLDDNEIVFLVTGSQAEPRAALYQMATQVYKGLTIEEGDTVVLSARIIPGNERAAIVGKREIKRTFIDDSGFEEIEFETVRERKKMAYEGMITLIMNINSKTGELQSTPQLIAQGVRGFESPNGGSVSSPTAQAVGNGSKNLFKDAERVVSAAIAGASKKTFEDESLLKEHVRVELKRFIQKETGAKPVIVPVIQQI